MIFFIIYLLYKYYVVQDIMRHGLNIYYWIFEYTKERLKSNQIIIKSWIYTLLSY